MGMIIYFHAASDETIRSILADPPKVFALLDDDSDEALAGDLKLDRARGEGRSIDLDKAWHAIHFLLNGTPWGGEPPLNLMLSEGATVGDEDVGYGPARAFSSKEAAAYATAVESLTGEMLMSRYNAEEMTRADIYPQIWDEGDIASYLVPYFDDLKKFLVETRQAGLGLIVSLR